MDEIRGSLSRVKKGIRNRIKGRKPDRIRADASGEGASSTSSFPQSESRIVVGGGHGRESGGAGDEEGEASQRSLHPDVAVQSGPGGEGSDVSGKKTDQVDPPQSTPAISHRGGPDNHVADSAIPDHVQEAFSPSQNEPSAADEKKPNWKSTASATAKLVLRGVRDSADAFGPLKSVAGGLCFVLENCERTKANEQAIVSLAPRVKALSVLLCKPVPEGDAKEEESRRKELERKLKNILRELEPLLDQGRVEGFFKNVENADKLGGLVEDIRDAMMDYQTLLQQDIYNNSRRLIETVDLTLLSGMHHTAGAGYLSVNRQGCLRGTRLDVLWQIQCWMTDEHDQRVFWLNGLAGTGKSTIAQTFAETSFSDGKLGASFFCSRDFEDRSNIQAIFPTLAFQLAYRYPQFRKELLPVLKVNPDVGRESLCSQLEKIIVGPLKATRIPTLIIIDALDECEDKEPASAILSMLSRYVDQIPEVKFFITGRPEPRIRSGFRLGSLRPITEVLKLHDVERSWVDNDIKLFFQTQLGDIAKTRSDCDFTENWLSSYDIDVLCKKAAGLFIYASTVVKFVASPYHLPTERLTLIITLPQSTAHEGKLGVDLLYVQVLEQAFCDVGSEDRDLYSRFRLVVGAVLSAFHPLSRKTLSELLKNCGAPSRISSTLRSLHSLLLVPESEVDPIRIFHKSFPDFLTDLKRCKDNRFFVDPSIHHADILFSCLNLMKEKLRKNICNLDGCPTLSEVRDLSARREVNIGKALEYACRFWTKHLAKIPGDSPHVKQVQEAIGEFFTKRLPFWIEVLSLTRNLNVCVYALYDIDQWYLSARVSCKWTNESQRLILSNFDAIRDSPTNIYHDALAFSPSSSWLHERYTAESLRAVEVVKGRPDKWGTCSREVSFNHPPEALAYCKDIVTVGLGSGDIVILDAITGACRSVLRGHTDGVISLAFSSDGALLASGSNDNTVKLWDVQTGGVVKTFCSDAHRPCSVSISPDTIMIASGSHNNAICLWDIRTGECCHIIEQCVEGQEGRAVTCINFLPTVPGCLMSASEGGFIQQWDVRSHTVGFVTPGHHIAFSSDGSRFVSCERRSAVVRNSGSKKVDTFLRPPDRGLDRCCLSPSGEFVVGVANTTFYVWDVASPATPIETFVVHGNSIFSLVFSSSIISASSDKSVRFWQIGGPSPNRAAMDTRSTTLASAEVTSIILQAEEGTAISINSAGVVGLWDLSTGLLKADFQTFEADGGYASDARLVDGVLTVAFCEHDFCNTWRISTWDAGKGDHLQTTHLPHGIDIHDRDLRISGDGSRVFGLDEQYIQTWSTSTGRSTGSIPFQRPYWQHSPSFIVDGSKLWVRSENSPAQGWDLNTPRSPPLPSSDAPSDGHRLDFIRADHTNGQNTGPTRINDTVTGKEVFRLPERFARPSVTQWDDRYLVAAYNGTGELLILDFIHMIPQ